MRCADELGNVRTTIISNTNNNTPPSGSNLTGCLRGQGWSLFLWSVITLKI